MVRALREARGWTQSQLAAVAGVSVRTVQRVEAGEPPSAETLLAIGAAFDVEPRELGDDGPHLVLEPGNVDPWPGLSLRVFKDGFQMGGCIALDSRRRTVRQLGFPHVVLPHLAGLSHDEYEARVVRVRDGSGPPEAIGFRTGGVGGLLYLVDGEPFDPLDHVREVRYDAVLVYGHFKAINHYRPLLPRHFVAVPLWDGPDPFPDEPPRLIGGAWTMMTPG